MTVSLDKAPACCLKDFSTLKMPYIISKLTFVKERLLWKVFSRKFRCSHVKWSLASSSSVIVHSTNLLAADCTINITISILLQHLLPLNIISSSSLSVVYNVMDFGAEDRFSYKASYAFHNEETCGPRRISSPIGKKIIIPYDHCCLVKRILDIYCKLCLTLARFDCKEVHGIAFGLEKLEAKSYISCLDTIVCFCFKVFGRREG